MPIFISSHLHTTQYISQPNSTNKQRTKPKQEKSMNEGKQSTNKIRGHNPQTKIKGEQSTNKLQFPQLRQDHSGRKTPARCTTDNIQHCKTQTLTSLPVRLISRVGTHCRHRKKVYPHFDKNEIFCASNRQINKTNYWVRRQR